MIDVRRWVWKLDMAGMLCVNDEYNVIVKFTMDGKRIKGKILHLSMELFKKLATHNNGPNIVQQIVIAAEDEYWKGSIIH